MASWYNNNGKEREQVDYTGIGQAAKQQGNLMGTSQAEYKQNQQNDLFGNPEANTYQNQSIRDMPTDYGTNVNSAINTGGSAYYANAMNTLGNQKAATSTLLHPYLGQNDDKVSAYMNSYAFNYSDPYGFMDKANGMDDSVNSALSAYAGNTYQDYLASPEYGQLADLYRQNGQLAMENTLGTASQMSGGLDSSYATAAAQQAYNGYMSNLQQAAQNAYQNQLSNQAAQLSALQGQQKYYAGMYGDDWNRAFDTFTDNDDRTYQWMKFAQDQTNTEKDRVDTRDENQAARKQTVDYGNSNLGYSYDALAEEGRQFDASNAENARQFDATLGYKYYDTNAGNATDITKANISAAAKGASGSSGQASIYQQYNMAMYQAKKAATPEEKAKWEAYAQSLAGKNW